MEPCVLTIALGAYLSSVLLLLQYCILNYYASRRQMQWVFLYCMTAVSSFSCNCGLSNKQWCGMQQSEQERGCTGDWLSENAGRVDITRPDSGALNFQTLHCMTCHHQILGSRHFGLTISGLFPSSWILLVCHCQVRHFQSTLRNYAEGLKNNNYIRWTLRHVLSLPSELGRTISAMSGDDRESSA